MRFKWLWLIALWMNSAVVGCAMFRPPAPPGNPFFVAANNEEAVWERAVDVVHDYFEIARENRLDGVIETQPKVGASILEPWHKDSQGARERLESTLQSIRRRALVNITPTEGGYLVGVEVYKEIEDVPNATPASAGSATFGTYGILQRDLNQVVGQSPPSGWLTMGRDPNLEQAILAGLSKEFSR